MKKVNFKQALTPWTLIILLVLALIIFIPAIGEYFLGKRDFLHLWHQQGQLLSETILRSADRISTFDQQADNVNRERLMDLGHYIRQIDSLNYPNNRPIRQYARREGRLMPVFFNESGKLIASRSIRHLQGPHERVQEFIRRSPPQETISFLPAELIGFTEIPAVIVHRSQGHGYIVLLPEPPRDRMIGPDKRHLSGWIDLLAKHTSLTYVILKKEQKILAQSGSVPDGTDVPASREPSWIIRDVEGNRVFEYAQSGPAGLQVIIGQPAAALEHLQSSLIRRLLINSFIILLIGSILVIYLVKKQNFSLLQDRYAHIQTYNASILENIDEGIIVLNQDRTISVMNQAAFRLLGISDHGILSTPISELAVPLSVEIVKAFMEFSVLSEVPATVTVSKKSLELLVSAQAIDLDNSELEQKIYIILIRNNTSQKELQDIRSRRSKLLAMGELASRVAHEIRNPLNGISVLAQRIQKEFKPDAENFNFERMTQSIRSESGRINVIIEAFLQYARTPELKLRRTELNAWMEETLPFLQAMGNVTFSEASAGKLFASIDSDQMKQALINLVKNAADVSSDNEQIKIWLEQRELDLVIQVEDNGPGISEKDKDHIFDLYFSTNDKGSGLGLSIVEKIVVAHGGKIQFESPYHRGESRLQGTRFEVFLPIS